MSKFLLGIMLALGVAYMPTSNAQPPVLPDAKAPAKVEPKLPKDEPAKVEPKLPKDEPAKHKGLKKPHDIEARHAKSWERHKHHLQALNVTATSFDCRSMGWVPDSDDQGQCGDCWVFSGADCCASAFMKAGYGKINFSKQQIIDCQVSDACNGGFPEDIAKLAKSTGLVTDEVYGKTYNASPGQCKVIDPSKFMKIADYGFCSQGSGVASYQDFKNSMVKFGVISLCLDASGMPSGGENGPLWKGNGGRNVDHAIKAVAFDDSRSPKGAVLCWGQWYGPDGTLKRDFFWAEWGANSIGDSAMWTSVNPLPPPPPPVPPTPPGPIPPGPLPPISLTAWTIDPVLKTLRAPADWIITGGKTSDTTIDMTAYSEEEQAILKAVVEAFKAKKKDPLPMKSSSMNSEWLPMPKGDDLPSLAKSGSIADKLDSLDETIRKLNERLVGK